MTQGARELAVLIVVIAAMYALGTGYYNGLRARLAQGDVTEDALVGLLDPQRPRIIAAVGVARLVLLLRLMVLKPGG